MYPLSLWEIVGGIVIIGFLIVLISWRISHLIHRRRLRAFLHRPLACSFGSYLFNHQKSLFDILIDLGISTPALDLVCGNLHWVRQEGGFNCRELNDRVAETVAQYGTYDSFVNQMKTRLKGSKKSLLPSQLQCTFSKVKQPSDVENPRGRIKEERQAFNSMFQALRDETKTKIARRLGIIHRFDYLISETFRSVAENDSRHLVASLDFESDSNADLFMSLGRLSAIAGGTMWAIGSASDALAGASDASSVISDIGTSGDTSIFEGLEDLGEMLLIAAPMFLAYGGIKKLGERWRERKLRKYKDEFKNYMEELSDHFFVNGEEQAMRVPTLIINALIIEQARLDDLAERFQRVLLGRNPKSNISRFSFTAIREGQFLNKKMLSKFRREIERLLRNVRRYNASGRSDIAGLHLYMNKDLVFLPSELSQKKIREIQECQWQLLGEVDRLKKQK